MTELSDEQKRKILAEIVELTATPAGRPPGSITSQEYADYCAVSQSTAGQRLRDGVKEGRLGYEKRRGVGYWWKLEK